MKTNKTNSEDEASQRWKFGETSPGSSQFHPMTPEQQVESVALLLALTHWRARMAYRRRVHGSLIIPDDVIDQSAKADAWKWEEKARKAMGISESCERAIPRPEHP